MPLWTALFSFPLMAAVRAQAQAFTDTWTWDDHANQCYEEILSNTNGVKTQQSIALQYTLPLYSLTLVMEAGA